MFFDQYIVKGRECEYDIFKRFQDSISSRPLINRLSIFEFGLDFAEIFDHKFRKIRLRGGMQTAEFLEKFGAPNSEV